MLRNPVTVQIGLAEPVGTVSHALYPVPSHLKTPLLMELLDHTDTESVLIFTRTKHRAKRLGEQLEKAGYSVASLQGNLSQNPGRPHSTASATANTRSSWPLISLPAASTSPASPTSSTTTSRTQPMPTPTASGVRPRRQNGRCLHPHQRRRYPDGALHRAGPRHQSRAPHRQRLRLQPGRPPAQQRVCPPAKRTSRQAPTGSSSFRSPVAPSCTAAPGSGPYPVQRTPSPANIASRRPVPLRPPRGPASLGPSLTGRSQLQRPQAQAASLRKRRYCLTIKGQRKRGLSRDL